MQAAVPLLQAFVQESDRASRVLRAVYGWTVGQHMEQGNGALCPMPVLTRTHTRTPAHDYEMFVWDNQWLHVGWISHDRRVWLVAKCESVITTTTVGTRCCDIHCTFICLSKRRVDRHTRPLCTPRSE